MSIPTPTVFTWIPGSQHKIDASNLPNVKGTKWVFRYWSDGATGSERMYTVPDVNSQLIPYFDEYFQLTLLPNPDGWLVAVTSGQNGYYLTGTPITIRAYPRAGFRFGEFMGTVGGNTNPLQTNIIAPFTIGAIFTPIQ